MADAFVGRHAELALLAREFEHAATGHPCLVVVEGPAGIGKTALVRQALQAASSRHILWASGEEMESSLAYGVARQLQQDTSASPMVQGADPLAVGAGLLDMLGTLQDGGLVTVLVDDAQWADPASLRALTFAFRRLRTDRVLLLICTRNIAESRFPEGFNRLMASAGTVRLKLGGLHAVDLAALGHEVGIPVTTQGATRLREHTEGNPLYARTLLFQLNPAELTSSAELLPAPHAYAQDVVAQLATCNADTILLVHAASVLGTTCRLDEVARLAELDDPLDALEQAVNHGLLGHRFATGDVTISFPHPLVRAAIYQDLGPHGRINLHSRAATLTSNTATQLQHRLRACAGRDDHLLTALVDYAHDQLAAGQWDNAAEYLSHAVGLAQDNVPTILIAETVDAMVQCGRFQEAVALSSSLLPVRGPAEAEADRAARAFVHGIVAHLSGQISRAKSLLTDAWRHGAVNPNRALARRTAAQLAMICLVQIDGPGTATWATRALELTEPGSDDDLLHYAQALGRFLSDRSTPVVTTGERGAILARAGAQLFHGDLGTAYRDLIALMRDTEPATPFRLLTMVVLSEVEFLLGHWDDALAHASMAISVESDGDQFWTQPFAHVVAATISTHRGEQDQASAHLSAARLFPPSAAVQQYVSCAEAALAASRDEPEAVVATLTPLANLASELPEHQLTMTTWSDLLIDAQVSLGMTDDARGVLEVFERFALKFPRPSHLAAVERARAMLLAGLGESGAAQRALDKALEHACTAERPFERAVIELSLGATLRRGGRRGAAAKHLRAAHKTMGQLGAQPYLLRCERELIACGHTVTLSDTRDKSRLTPQEHAVAELAVTGLTNRQIARELMLSVKTIEYHLGNIYAKLGVATRAELAARHHSG